MLVQMMNISIELLKNYLDEVYPILQLYPLDTEVIC